MTKRELGGLRAAETNKIRHGEDFYRKIGRAGGIMRNPNKGFGASRERASEAGRRGGLKSKRGS